MRHQRTIQFAVAIVTIFSMMFGLATPRSVFAAEPPPPPTGGNDLGGEQPVAPPAPEESAPPEEEITTDTPLVDTTLTTSAETADSLGLDELLAGNVQWCPTGVIIGGAGCTTNQTSIEAALTLAKSYSSGDGTIWVQNSFTSSSHGTMITIDANTFHELEHPHHDETLTLAMIGGVNWTNGTFTLGSNLTLLEQPITISNFTGSDSFRLANFNIQDHNTNNNTIYLDNASNVLLEYLTVIDQGNGSGINLSHSDNVDISNVTITESGNGDGITVHDSDNLEVSNTTVNPHDDGDGVNVSSGSNITLTNVVVTESENYGAYFHDVNGITITGGRYDSNQLGIYIDNIGTGAGTVTLSGVQANSNTVTGGGGGGGGDDDILEARFSSENNSGFVFIGSGNVNIYDSTFSNNPGNGAYIDTCGYSSGHCHYTGNLVVDSNSLALSNAFSDNGHFGLYTDLSGTLLVDEANLINNLLSGMMANATNDVTISSSTANENHGFGMNITSGATDSVTLTYVVANSNSNTGVAVYTPGSVFVDQIYASNNSGYGLFIDNGASNVTVTNLPSWNILDNNSLSGLFIESHGNVFVEYTTADGNHAYGAQITTNGNVSVTDPYVLSHYNGNDLDGLNISAGGTVTLNGLSAGNNYGNGAYISAGGNLFVNYSSFTNNVGSGLQALITGDIEILNSTANDNHVNGMILNSSAIDSVTLNNVTASGNAGFGFLVFSAGNVNGYKVTANNNGLQGAAINAAGNVTFTGSLTEVSTFNGNTLSGLWVSAVGNISLDWVIANGNHNDGVTLQTGGDISVSNSSFSGNDYQGAWIDGNNVTLTNVNADSNTHNGVVVHALGNVTIDQIYAENNGMNGLVITNGGNVTINNSVYWNELSINGMDGLNINSQGNVFVYRTNTSVNDGDGMHISAGGSITIDGDGSFNKFNDGYGLHLFAIEDVSITGVNADWNQLDGANVFAFWGGVDVADSTFLYNWYGNGLYIDAWENVNVTDVNASNNAFEGLQVNWAADVSITDSVFNNNGVVGTGNKNDGIDLYNVYNVTLLNVTSTGNLNGGEGLDITNAGGAIGNISVTNSNFNNNTGFGMAAEASGNITLNSVNVNDNGQNGAMLFADGNISVYYSDFSNNQNLLGAFGYGLWANAQGDVTVENSSANDNASDGMNIFSAANDTVTLNDVTANDNVGTGVAIYTPGNVFINVIDASRNGGDGLYVDNCMDMGSGCTGVGNVVVINSSFSNWWNDLSENGQNGMEVYSNGNVTFAFIWAQHNTENGAYIQTWGVDPLGVVIGSDSTFWFNHENGLEVYGYEAGLSYIDASFNDGDGAYIQTYSDTSITEGWFGENDGYGAYIDADFGLVDVQDSDFHFNGLDGLHVNDAWAFDGEFINATNNNGDGIYLYYATSYVNLWGSNVLFNEGDGADLAAGGLITVDSLDAHMNSEDGLEVYFAGAVGVFNSYLHDNAGSGLNVVASVYEVNLGNVDSLSNGVYGADIYTYNGYVYVVDSMFNDNDWGGIYVDAGGFVYLLNVDANDNGGDGANLFSWGGSSLTDGEDFYTIALEGVNFDDNAGNGVTATTPGGIYASEIYANDNEGSGAVLDNCFDLGSGCEGWGNILITNPPDWNEFFDNDAYGLWVNSNGEVSVIWSDFADNGMDGAYIQTFGDYVDVYDSTANDNAGNGFAIYSGGDVYLDEVEANSNAGNGAFIEAAGWVGVDESSFGWFDWDNYLSYGNDLNGLQVIAGGDIYIYDSEASDNLEDGMLLYSQSTDSVYLYDVATYFNWDNGIEVYTPGDIYLDTIYSEENGLNGVYLDNCLDLGSGCTGEGNITVTSWDDWNEINYNNASGLIATSNGDIDVEYSDFVSNWDNGAELQATDGEIDVYESSFDWNGLNGLVALSEDGNINVSDSYFAYNAMNGAYLETGDDVNVYLSYFYGNGFDYGFGGFDGLFIVAGADVYLENVASLANAGNGAFIDAGGWVEVYDSLFGWWYGDEYGYSEGNGMDGLVVFSDTSILLDGVAAFSNAGNGASLFTDGTVEVYDSFFGEDHDTSYDNDLGEWVLGSNPVDWGNGGAGLYIEASGTVYLENVMADKNFNSGIEIISNGMVTILDSDADWNGEDNLSLVDVLAGVYIHDTTGQVYIEDLVAGHNNFGLFVDTTRSVTVVGNMTGTNDDIFGTQFTNNTLSGMVIFSGGTINLFQVESSRNGGDGADLFANFIRVESSEFNHNGGWGLAVDATNSITFLKVTACYNTFGPYVLLGGALTINESNFCDDTSDLPEDEAGMYLIVNVFTDVNVGAATLKSNYGVIFIYLKRNADGTGDIELARITLAPGIVPDGTIGTFRGLAEGDVPAGFNGSFGGTSFDFTLVGPDGVPMSSIPGTLQVRFTVQPDKNYGILWYDAVQKKWFELLTTVSGPFAYANATQTGVFLLVAK